jgi:hypothetical protein
MSMMGGLGTASGRSARHSSAAWEVGVVPFCVELAVLHNGCFPCVLAEARLETSLTGMGKGRILDSCQELSARRRRYHSCHCNCPEVEGCSRTGSDL